MKKVLLIIFLLITTIAFWYSQSRKFFCLGNNNCITVWKTYNDKCYIIPGKYYGIFCPANEHIESSNSNLITLYFNDELPHTIIYKSEQDVKVIGSKQGEFVFYDYNADIPKFDKILYIPNAIKNSDVKTNTSFMDLFIGENYAIDKNGEKL